MENREIQSISNDTRPELTEVLTRAETEFGLSEVLQKYGVSRNEPITIEFRCSSGVLLGSQTRYVDSSNVSQCCWSKEEEQDIVENREVQQISSDVELELVKDDTKSEVAEVLNRANLMSGLSAVLQRQGLSERETVLVEFRGRIGISPVKCPCRPGVTWCCQG